MVEMRIGDRVVSDVGRPFVIAEIGVNYYDIAKQRGLSLMDAARLMIQKAAESGADAVKFQSYKAEKITSRNSPAYWDLSKEPTASQFELFKKFDRFGLPEYAGLSRYAHECGVVFLSTPFDVEAVDYLDALMPAYKIASADLTNYPLLERVARKRKPVVLSTGASDLDEIRDAVGFIESHGNSDVALLHCVLDYPTRNECAQLGLIRLLKTEFPGQLVGYSDHTVPDGSMFVLTMAAALGASIIEKHFTLDKSIVGNDHFHSMDAADLRRFSDNLDQLTSILGSVSGRPVLPNEAMARRYARRSVVAAVPIAAGSRITSDLLTCKRPGTGISPKDMPRLLGKTAVRDIDEDELVSFDMVR